MKKFIIITIILLLLIGGIWLLNYFDIIDPLGWGEEAIVNAPVVGNYITTDEEYEILEQEYQILSMENEQLQEENWLLQQQVEELEQDITMAEEEIEVLEDQLALLEDDELRRQERLTKVIDIYSEMDPFDAAQIINSMERELALLILANISSRQAAVILGRIEPSLAAELTFHLEQMEEEVYQDIIDETENFEEILPENVAP